MSITSYPMRKPGMPAQREEPHLNTLRSFFLRPPISGTTLSYFVFLLAVVLQCNLATGANAQDPVAWWTFDRILSDKYTMEQVSRMPTAIQTPFRAQERIPGPVGQALRLDGYSVWLEWKLSDDAQPVDALTVMAWIAVETYPVANAPITAQYRFPEAGYYFGLDPWGTWYLAVSIEGEWYTCSSPEPLQKGEWVHLGGSFDSQTGLLRLYLNGEKVQEATVPALPLTPDKHTLLTVGRDPHTPTLGAFEKGLLNGALDEVKLYQEALDSESIKKEFDHGVHEGKLHLTPPIDRFSEDLHRPTLHAMPPANWTNEPHGLVRHGDIWHIFHQRNANGPYLDQIHWGHMISRDLVNWKSVEIALAPEPGWDQRGTWAGDAVVHNDTLMLLYTGVDGIKAGIGLAKAVDSQGLRFNKHPANPLIPSAPEGSLDFRDTYLWKNNDTWNMIIGSGMPEVGGIAPLYTSTDLVEWTAQGNFFESTVDVSGVFFELPIFVPLTEQKAMFGITTIEPGLPARYVYWTGTTDNNRFVPDSPEPQPLDLFNHFLSPTVATADDGRTIAMGIIAERRTSEAQLEAGWAHLFSFPRVLTLCEDGQSICQQPANELQSLRGKSRNWNGLAFSDTHPLIEDAPRTMEIRVDLAGEEAQQFGLDLLRSASGEEYTRIYYDQESKTLNLDLTHSSLSPTVFEDVKVNRSTPLDLLPGDRLFLHIFLDHSVIEVYVNDKSAFATRAYPALETSTGLGLFAHGGRASAHSIQVWELSLPE